MKLRYSPTSPYVRKVHAVAIETGLIDQIELVLTNGWAPDTDLPNDNPLGKVPTLILDNGESLFDSPVICQYLDAIQTGPKLISDQLQARFHTLRWEAMADGMIDAAVNALVDRVKKTDSTPSAWYQQRQMAAIVRTLDVFEKDAPVHPADQSICLGVLALACALGYLDFRYPDLNWREGRPRLDAWYEELCQRPAIRDTVPVADN
jgi:glutathione S-transferase